MKPAVNRPINLNPSFHIDQSQVSNVREEVSALGTSENVMSEGEEELEGAWEVAVEIPKEAGLAH